MAHEEYTRYIPESRTAIIFIHGILGTPDHFTCFLPLIPKNWTVRNILLDGHGGSSDDFAASSMAKWKTQAAHEIERLCCEHENVIVAAHSMGTLFALNAAASHPDKVRALFLLACPLKVRIAPSAVINSTAKVLNLKSDSPVIKAAKAASSVRSDRRVWKYLKWIPRFLELLSEIKKSRNLIPSVPASCLAVQSRHDELVSPAAAKYFESNENITCRFLENSSHYYYHPDDMPLLLSAFSDFCADIEKNKG